MRRLKRDNGLEDIFEQMQRFADEVQEKGMNLGERSVPLDVQEDEDKVKIIADMPGVEKQDINLKVDEDTVSITAEHKSDIKEENEKYVRRERRRDAYRRTISWPVEIDTESVTASYDNGVLEITAEKEDSPGHNIHIE